MCTLVAFVQTFASFPLVIAANRDEFLGRPARGPFVWPHSPPIVSPRDEQAGGTWLGLSATGLFVGVTNRSGLPLDPARRSRGALVVESLSAPNARALHDQLGRLDALAFNPFHLVYADARSAFLTASDGQTLTQRALEKGVHVITEQSADNRGSKRAELLLSRIREGALSSSPDVAALKALISEHVTSPRDGPCVHFDDLPYGTRSSLLLLLGERLSDSRFFWAEGPPCRTPFEERADLVQALT